jgi:hypothetical protein
LSVGEIIALLTALAALTGVLFNAWHAHRQDARLLELEKRKSELVRQENAEKSKLDYEYEARKRLYTRFEPLTFQLLDLAEYAIERIKALTEPRIWREFTPAEDEEQAWQERRPVLARSTYSLVSSLYGLLAPLVIVRFMSRELTLADLSLDPRIELQYFLASKAYGVLKDDERIAEADPPIRYDPFARGWRELRRREPSTYWWQGLTMGRLEAALDLLTKNLGDSAHERLASFGEFELLYADALSGDEPRTRKSLAAAANPLMGFRPADRPVYWRILIAQARLYQALIRTRHAGFESPRTTQEWTMLLELENRDEFEWSDEARDAPGLDETLGAVDLYLKERVIAPRLMLRGESGR